MSSSKVTINTIIDSFYPVNLLTDVFLNMIVSNPLANVVDTATDVIFDVVYLKSDALLLGFPQIFVESFTQERFVLIHHPQQVPELLHPPGDGMCFPFEN